MDRLAERWRAGRWRRSGERLQARATVADGGIALVKPTTWMNRSGVAVRALRGDLECEPGEILVCYDDLALPLGRLRLRPGGSHGGHNGVRSVIERLGTTEFPRLRVGIAPLDRAIEDGSEFVLAPFGRRERPVVDEAVVRAAEAVECAVTEDLLTAMNRYNPEPS